MFLVEQSLKHNAQDLEIKGYNDNYWTGWSPMLISRKDLLFSSQKKKKNHAQCHNQKWGGLLLRLKSLF